MGKHFVAVAASVVQAQTISVSSLGATLIGVSRKGFAQGWPRVYTLSEVVRARAIGACLRIKFGLAVQRT